MIDERLLQLNYYLDKLSMYFRSSYGIEEQFAMIHNILSTMNSELDKAFENINVVSPDIINVYNELDETGQVSDMLDKIASIYGITRQFSVTYVDENDIVVTENLSLTNYELLILVRARIIQNTYKGTYEECMKMYKLINLQDDIIINFDTEDATCNIYLRPMSLTVTDNIKHMFLAGLLTLKSLGITYNHYYYDVSQLGIWDETDWNSSTRLWY